MRKSLRLQILIPFLALIIAASGAATMVGYNSIKEYAVESATDNTETLVGIVNQNVDLYLKEYERMAKTLSGNDQIQRYVASGAASKEGKAAWPAVQDTFQEAIKSNDQLVNIYVASTSKEMTVEPPADLPAGFDPTTRDWYKEALASPQHPVWIEPYIDTATKKMVLTVSMAIQAQGKPIGVLGIDLKVDSIMSLLNEVTVGKSGYIFILDAQNKLLAHKKTELIGSDQSKEKFIGEMKAKGAKSTISYTYEGQEKLMSYVTNGTTGWKICGTVFSKEFEDEAGEMLGTVMWGLLIIIAVAGAVSWPVTQSIIRPVRKLQEAMKEFQNGKLRTRSGVKRSNEIGKLASGFDEMAEQVDRLITRIHKTSEKLGESSQVLMVGSAETSASAGEVARAIQEIAAGAGSQAGIADRNAEIVLEMADQIDTVAQETGEMERLTMQMQDIARVNVERLDALSDQTAKSVGMSRSVSEAIRSLDECSEQIGGIVAVISDITNQTNLLALNAAIEAARAGEHGRGFGVVAGEVRKLAGHSEEALAQVQELVERIRKETHQATALSESAGQAMVEQERTVRQTHEAFGTIHAAVERHLAGIGQVVRSVRELTEGKDIISANTTELQAICQTTAAGTEEVTASVEEQSAAMEQLSHLARQLEEAAAELRSEVQRFDI
ncbi:methyl-accepting chemotaxis protein [Gorillibacterium sp. sgz5001074]|uniref:methyl-accepting chemotaxis protein n=1 Tax=Gorillibacterium sp. sgz5001074 TaxID=3446695 RepID=UPI003F679E8E